MNIQFIRCVLEIFEDEFVLFRLEMFDSTGMDLLTKHRVLTTVILDLLSLAI